MLKEEIRVELDRQPFVPLRIHLEDGKHYDIPMRRAAHILGYGLLVFIGSSADGIEAKAYDRFPFDRVARIERRSASGKSRKKAS